VTGTASGPGPAGHDRILSLGTRVLSYTVWGDPGGEPVMLVHGLNTERHLWTPIARQLASRYLVVCPDLRGHGDSSWAPDGYHLAGFVADLHTLAGHLGIFPFHYVGHSLGARVGIAYAGELSPTLRTLTLSDSGPEVSRAGALAVRDARPRSAPSGPSVMRPRHWSSSARCSPVGSRPSTSCTSGTSSGSTGPGA
jgi:pimeloyl-ACP methyl ester carboxylesterase